MAGVDILATAFSGGNAAFLADLYARWVSDPGSVDPSFVTLFAALDDEAVSILQDASGASWAPRHFEVEPPMRPSRRPRNRHREKKLQPARRLRHLRQLL